MHNVTHTLVCHLVQFSNAINIPSDMVTRWEKPLLDNSVDLEGI
jgi:hypothetical protein